MSVRLTRRIACTLFFFCSAAAGTNKGHEGTDHAKLAKLDRENEVAPPSKVSPSVGKAIGQARQAKGMTQKDLGTKINEKPQVIQEYESVSLLFPCR